ncbi:TonB-dependent receptor [uncultured Algimonas sp.]|uniref:TonB-dependent receptor n=1 Tax=uncultured Algimonas sp. TaxID=1547920 RepID=UPI002625DDB4|nr:TonB-dependent receptor [uncultured Algimonas sp.]
MLPSYLTGAALGAVLLAGTSFGTARAQGAIADEVIVTAQKREQSQQDVPVSLGVVRGEALDVVSSGAEDILFLSARVPSVYAEGSFGRTFPRFYIRGLGNTDFDLNANQPVSLVYDGVVLENPVLKGFPVFDLDRIEVLRGPQGTLFGRNTPAGVIKFESARPTHDVEGYVRGAYGRFGTVDLEGAVSGPLSETLSARLSGLFQSRDDYVDNVAPNPSEAGYEEFDEYAARLQLLFEPVGDTTVLLNLHGRQLDGGSRTYRANAIRPGTGGLVAGFDRFEASQDADQLLDVSNLGGSLTIESGIGPGTLTAITAYERVRIDARGDVDGGFGAVFAPPSGPGIIPFAAESQDNITGHGQWTQELRYNFDASSALNVTFGGFAFIEKLEIESLSFDTLGGGVVNGQAVQDQDTESYALFTSMEWQATDRLTATGGLRISAEKKDFTASRLIGPFGSGTLGPVTRSLDDTVVTGDLALTYAVNDALNLFTRYSRGFRAPNVQGRIVFGDAVTVADTETIDSIDVGFKSRVLDGRGTVSATAFLFETRDQQLTAVGGAGNFNQLLNADAVGGRGIELDATLDPTDHIQLSAGFSINDTEIHDGDLEVGPCGAPCTILDPVNPLTGNARIDGNPLPQAPKYIANASARFGLPVSASGEIFVFADVAHRSAVNFFLYESAEFRSNGLTEVGLRGGYMHEDGLEIAAYVRNSFDALALEGAVDFNNFTAFINEPAIYGVEVTKRF